MALGETVIAEGIKATIPALRSWLRQGPWLSALQRDYVEAFVQLDRAPTWDDSVFLPSTIKRTHVVARRSRLTEPALDPEVLASYDPRLGNAELVSTQEYALKLASAGFGSAVNLIVGSPGIGKSTFVLQVATHIANCLLTGKRLRVPIYANLRMFDKNWAPTKAGFEDFLRATIENACPRYLKFSVRDDHYAADILGMRPAPIIIIDSIDEITDSYVQRIKAITMFINEHPNNRFILTCRPRDLTVLRDHSMDFRIARLDLVRWDRDTLRKNTGGAPDPERASPGPVFTAHPGPQFEAADWSGFVESQLRRVSDDESMNQNVVGELAATASAALVGLPPVPLGSEIRKLAVHAGLVHDTGDDRVVFAVRPIETYFAAVGLARRPNPFSVVGRPESVNIRESMIQLFQIKRQDATFLDEVERLVPKPSEIDPRSLAERLMFLAECLTTDQIAARTTLSNGLADGIRFLLGRGDPVSRQQGSQILAIRPRLLRGEHARSLVDAVTRGSSVTARVWLLSTLLSNRALRGESGPETSRLFRKLIDERQVGATLRVWIDQACAKRSVLAATTMNASIRVLCAAAFLAMLYSIYWTSLLSLKSTIGLTPLDASVLLVLKAAPTPFLPTGPGLPWLRIVLFIVCAGVPAWLIHKQAATNNRFQRALTRVLGYACFAWVIRFVFFAPLFAIGHPTAARNVTEIGYVVLAASYFVILGVYVLLWRRGKGEPRKAGRDTVVILGGVALLIASTNLIDFVRMSITRSERPPWGILVALIIVIATVALLVVPLLRYWNLRRVVLRDARSRLSSDYDAAFRGILDVVMNPRGIRLIRIIHLDLMRHMHYQRRHAEQLDKRFRSLPSGDPLAEALARVVLQALKESGLDERTGRVV